MPTSAFLLSPLLFDCHYSLLLQSSLVALFAIGVLAELQRRFNFLDARRWSIYKDIE